MNVLAVDTSVSDITIVLKTDTYYDECLLVKTEGMASSVLVPRINEMCAKRGIKPKNIDLFLCTKGPGSFTGLRIAMATLKGMAFAGGKPLVSVPTTEVYANRIEDYEGCVVVAIDARKSRYYLAVYELKDGVLTRVTEDTDGNAEDILSALAPYDNVLVAGPREDASLFAEKLGEALHGEKRIETRFEDYKSMGMSLYECGLARYESAGADDIAEGPLYIRKSDAEIAREQKP